jgi:hypothetical protein
MEQLSQSGGTYSYDYHSFWYITTDEDCRVNNRCLVAIDIRESCGALAEHGDGSLNIKHEGSGNTQS